MKVAVEWRWDTWATSHEVPANKYAVSAFFDGPTDSNTEMQLKLTLAKDKTTCIVREWQLAARIAVGGGKALRVAVDSKRGVLLSCLYSFVVRQVRVTLAWRLPDHAATIVLQQASQSRLRGYKVRVSHTLTE